MRIEASDKGDKVDKGEVAADSSSPPHETVQLGFKSEAYYLLGLYPRMDDLDTAIREFTPQQGMWLPLERHFERAFSSPDPKHYYHAIFNLFERFPEEDGAGVFWSALHGMEAVG